MFLHYIFPRQTLAGPKVFSPLSCLTSVMADPPPKRPRRENDGDQDTDSEMVAAPQVCPQRMPTDLVPHVDPELDSSLVDFVRKSQPARQSIQPTANEEELQERMISAAFRARQRIIENARFPGTEKELSLVGLLERFPMTREALVITGIGFLTTDSGLWSEKFRPRIQRVQKHWRKLVKGAKRDPMQGHSSVSLAVTDKPLGGYKVQSFMKTADHLGNFLCRKDEWATTEDIYKEAAFRLVFHGLCTPTALDGLRKTDAHCFSSKPEVRYFLARAFQRATDAGSLKRVRAMDFKVHQAEMSTRLAAAGGPRIGMDVADMITALSKKEAREQLDSQFAEIGLPGNHDKPLPRNFISVLMRADSHTQTKAMELLHQRTDTYKAAVVQGSCNSVASGIRCWHMFASNFLDYGQTTLPITIVDHVIMYIGIFVNGGTAANYICYLRYAHRFFSWPTDQWDTPEVAFARKGIKKINLLEHGRSATLNFLFTEDLI